MISFLWACPRLEGLSNDTIAAKLGRAVRYNRCCASLHRGFLLPSLTQNQTLFIGIAFFIEIEFAIVIVIDISFDLV